MSELIDNSRMKKDALKHLILQLHQGTAPEAVRAQLARLMGEVPYGLVVEVEQELIADGDLPVEEVLKLCDVHSAALKGIIDLSETKEPPAGHPVDVFRRENRALEEEIRPLAALFRDLRALPQEAPAAGFVPRMLGRFRRLQEVDRHYRRKENLLFPYLEKRGITGPSTVMWGKDDEARAMLKGAIAALEAAGEPPAGTSATGGAISSEAAATAIDAGSLQAVLGLVLEPAAAAVEEMIFKEEQILFPMSLDHLTEAEWRAIAAQTGEIGLCLIGEAPEWGDDPQARRAVAGPPAVAAAATLAETGPAPEAALAAAAPGRPVVAAPPPPATPVAAAEPARFSAGLVRMPSGSLSVDQLTALLDTLPFDVTFVDAEDRVRYFTQGKERIFDRNLAILGRKVQQCHPPSSVHVVQRIVDDFRAGRQDRAAFWITLRGRFVHIEYFAVRDAEGAYLGTLEVTQDLTELRRLEGERRLLNYEQSHA